MKCPQCNSDNTHFRSNKNNYICDDCDLIFYPLADQVRLRVFVSYGHDEYLPFAREVAKYIKEKYDDVFFDEDRLQPGGDWESYIENGLDWVRNAGENGRILLIMTPHSVRRPDGYCLNEIARALDSKVDIIPIMLVWTMPPLSIYRLQWLDMQQSFSENIVSKNFSNDFAKISHALENPYTLDREGGMNRLMESLEPLDFRADLTLYQSWFTGREWLFDEVKAWLKEENGSRLFFITGVPGIGKTAVATHLLHNFPGIGAFHLCRRENSEKSSPRRAVCTLAYQLSTQLPEYRELLLTMNLKKEIKRCNDVALFDTLIVQPLNKSVDKLNQPLVILIDGLDEASIDGRNSMAQFIALEFEKLPKWFRFIIFSRPEEEVVLPLQSFHPRTLSSDSSHNQQDIRSYLEKRLKRFNTRKRYNAILDILQNKANGNFLYVKHVCDEIEKENLKFEEPDKFPTGLGSIYHSYFSSKFANKEYYRQNIRPALQLLIATPIPLNERQIKYILDWSDDQWSDFLMDIGSFIIINKEGCVVPFHISLYEWLTNQEKCGRVFLIDSNTGKVKAIESLHVLLNKIISDNSTSQPIHMIDCKLMESTGWTISILLSLLLKVSLSVKNMCVFDQLYQLILHINIFSYLYQHDFNNLYMLFGLLNTYNERWTVYLQTQCAAYVEQGYIAQLSSILMNGECYRCLIDLNEKALEIVPKGEVRYQLMNNLGRSYYKLGVDKGKLSCDFYESLINEFRVTTQVDELVLNKITLQYAIALRDFGALEKAFPLYKKIVESYLNLKVEDYDSSWAFSNFALCLYTYNNDNESIRLFQKAINIRKAIYGEHAEEVAWIYCCYQAVLFTTGKFKEAIDIAGTAYHIYKNRYGDHAQKLAWSLSNYGNMLVNYGNYAEATKLYIQSAELNNSLIPESKQPHIYTLTTLNSLATNYWLSGDQEKAIKQINETVYFKEKMLEDMNPFLANSYLNMGIILGYESIEQAQTYVSKAISIYYTKFGEDFYDLIYAELISAFFYYQQGNQSIALKKMMVIKQKLDKNTIYSFLHHYWDRLFYKLTKDEKSRERLIEYIEFENMRIYLTRNNESEILGIL